MLNIKSTCVECLEVKKKSMTCITKNRLNYNPQNNNYDFRQKYVQEIAQVCYDGSFSMGFHTHKNVNFYYYNPNSFRTYSSRYT